MISSKALVMWKFWAWWLHFSLIDGYFGPGALKVVYFDYISDSTSSPFASAAFDLAFTSELLFIYTQPQKSPVSLLNSSAELASEGKQHDGRKVSECLVGFRCSQRLGYDDGVLA